MTEKIVSEVQNAKKVTPDELGIEYTFNFISEHFEKLKCDGDLNNILPLLQKSLEHENTLVTKTTPGIDTLLSKMISNYGNDDIGMEIILLLLYQCLQIIHEQNLCSVPMGLQPLQDLVERLYADQLNTKLSAILLLCVKIYVRAYNAELLVGKLWSHLQKENKKRSNWAHNGKVFIHLYDELLLHVKYFHRSKELTNTIQFLLTSTNPDDRKAACYLLKKTFKVTVECAKHTSDWEVDSSGDLYRCWNEYIKIMECLEKHHNQSKAILTSLRILRTLENNKVVPRSWPKWTKLIYQKILDQDYIANNHWPLEYILETFTCYDLTDDMARDFLKALNNSKMYDPDGYVLPTKHIRTFLKFDQTNFLEHFTEIAWEPVPLNFWLEQLHVCGQPLDNVSISVLMKLADRVGALQNPSLQYLCINQLETIFENTIDTMELSDYIKFVETAYNSKVSYNDFETLANKLEQCCSVLGQNIKFSQRFYEVITGSDWDMEDKDVMRTLNAILQLLDKEPKIKHGWLRYLIVCDSEYSNEIGMFCERKYDIDLLSLKNSSLEEVKKELTIKLICSKDEEQYVIGKAVDFFVCNVLKEFADLTSYDINLSDLLTIGSHKTITKLSELLVSHNNQVDATVLDAFVEAMKTFLTQQTVCGKVAKNILSYVQVYPDMEHYAENLRNISLDNLEICRNVVNHSSVTLTKEAILQGVLFGEYKSEKLRIEEAYKCQLNGTNANAATIRLEYAKKMKIEYFADLLNINTDLSATNGDCGQNSEVHRKKIRIATAIAKLMTLADKNESTIDWFEGLWNILMHQFNQPNVTFIYEVLTAKSIWNFDDIENKLIHISDYTIEQQMSVMSVTHFYCLLRLADIPADRLDGWLNYILPLAMGAVFKLRRFAQLVIYNILSESIKLGKNFANVNEMSSVLKNVLGDQLNDIANDIRLQLFEICKKFTDENGVCSLDDLVNVINYVTKAPFDEYLSGQDYTEWSKMREQYTSNNRAAIKEVPIADVSQEVNEMYQDLNYTDSELREFISNAVCKGKEVFVVASLVDKLPNLGGIARTCAVLGIRNLVISSKKHTERTEFQNLSLSAEQKLNIIEVQPNALAQFLNLKKSEGFRVVGAEQTANSKNLIDFEFPEKCIILLGHEKEGIPANLLDFLNYAVEIPQFGMIVRSLNVHVAGALFMWEYGKQHLIDRKN